MELFIKMEGKPVAILLTGTFDHIMAARHPKEYNIKIYIHEEEKQVLESPSINLSSSWSAAYVLEADEWVKDGQELKLAGFKDSGDSYSGTYTGFGFAFISRKKGYW